jgi:hypothetical protein
MRIRTTTGRDASPLLGLSERRNTRASRLGERFVIVASGQIIGDRCVGAQPAVFVGSVTGITVVRVGGGR